MATIKNIFRKKTVEENKSSVEEFAILSQKLGEILTLISTREILINNWEDLLSNAETGENVPSLIKKGKRRGLMEAYNKKWIAFSMALALYRMLLIDMQRFVSEKAGFAGKIRTLDPKLADKIDSLKFLRSSASKASI